MYLTYPLIHVCLAPHTSLFKAFDIFAQVKSGETVNLFITKSGIQLHKGKTVLVSGRPHLCLYCTWVGITNKLVVNSLPANLFRGSINIYILCHYSTLIWHRHLKSFLK